MKHQVEQWWKYGKHGERRFEFCCLCQCLLDARVCVCKSVCVSCWSVRMTMIIETLLWQRRSPTTTESFIVGRCRRPVSNATHTAPSSNVIGETTRAIRHIRVVTNAVASLDHTPSDTLCQATASWRELTVCESPVCIDDPVQAAPPARRCTDMHDMRTRRSQDNPIKLLSALSGYGWDCVCLVVPPGVCIKCGW